MAERVKSADECRKEYEAIAKRVTSLVASRPKVRVEIERRVKQELGDIDKQIADAMAQKSAAAKAMYAAEAREAPEREAKAKAQAEAKAKAELAAIAQRNAERHQAQERALTQRLREI